MKMQNLYLFFVIEIYVFLGVAGAGGVVLYFKDQKKINYAWGLGTSTNNQAKYLKLWKELELSINKGLKKMIILGYLMIVIRKVFKLKTRQRIPNSKILNKITMQLERIFPSITYIGI